MHDDRVISIRRAPSMPRQPIWRCISACRVAGGGTATVVVTTPDGRTRALFFLNGKFDSADSAQADGHPELQRHARERPQLDQVGAERYEICDAVTFGG